MHAREKPHKTCGEDPQYAAPCYNARMIRSDRPTLSAHAPRSGARRAVVLACVFAAAAILIALGVAEEAFSDVWQRASMVCYECIGIG